MKRNAGWVEVSVFSDGLTTVIDSRIYDAEPDVLGEWVYSTAE